MDKTIDTLTGLLAARGDVGLTILIAGLIGWFLVSTIFRLIAEGKASDAGHAKELRELAEKTAAGLAESRSATVLTATALGSTNTQLDKANTVLALLPQAIESIDGKQDANALRVEGNARAINDLSLKIAESFGRARA